MVSQLPLLVDAGQSGGLRTIQTGNPEFLVSVVCVTRNAATCLPDLLRSINEQKVKAVEFLVIDGESDDETVDILKDNGHLIDFWISSPDMGIYDAMNRALDLIRGKWVIFLGADDRLLSGFGRILHDLKNPYTIYYGDVLFYGKHFTRTYDDYYLTKLNICQQCIFYPAAVFKKYKFDLKYQVYADYHLNLRCWNDPRFSFQHLNHTVSYFSDGGFSSFTKDTAFERERDLLFKKYLKRGSYYRYLNRTLGFGRALLRFLQNK